MHTMNVKGMIFTGKKGRIAINQILKAKPTKNRYTTTVKQRSIEFIQNFNSFKEFSEK